MKLASLAFAAALLASTSATAAPIIGLCNTGQNQQCNGLKNGSGAELNWGIINGPNPNVFTPNQVPGSWIGVNGTSRWITPSNNGNQSYDPSVDGLYKYVFNFTIGAGFSPATASLLGRFAADNLVDSITLNGNTITGSGGNFSSWTNFSANSGFLSGNNTLIFNVRNLAQASGNPTGLRVEFLESSIGAVPEPTTWAMMILGFGVIGGAMRRRRRQLSTRTVVAFG